MSALGGYSGYKPPPRGISFNESSMPQPSRHQSNNSHEQFMAYREVAKIHYFEIGAYLNSKNGLSNRGNAKEKLVRLSRQQFQELSTDVYDELVRRKQAETTSDPDRLQPFLQPEDSFHPKRNQARRKLATLPASRFNDLASDVYIELERRYPDLADEQPPMPDASMDSSYGYTNGGPLQQQQPQEQQQARVPQRQDSNPLNRLGSGSRRPMSPPSANQLMGKQPSLSKSAPQSSAANEVLVANKSTLVDEDVGPRATSPANDMPNGSSGRGIHEVIGSPFSSTTQQNQSSYNARSSEASSMAGRLIGGYANTDSGQGPDLARERRAWDAEKEEEIEKIRSDYEFRVTQLSRQLSESQRDLEETQGQTTMLQERAKEAEDEIRQRQRRLEEQTSQMRAHERDLSSLREQASLSDQLQDEVQELRTRLETHSVDTSASDSIIAELKAEVKGLLDELSSANNRMDAVSVGREQDADRVRTLEAENQSLKAKARQQGSFGKADSDLYNAAVPDERPHMSADGAFSESHVQAFQSSIDALLLAGRSQGISALLKATNDVVVAVTRLDNDVQDFENSRQMDALADPERDQLATLKDNCHATVSNLVTAAKNHVAASGLSPVSLLDAAASHLSVTIVGMLKLLRIRGGGSSNGRMDSFQEEKMSRSKPPPLPTSAKSFGSDQSSMRQQQPSPDKPQLSSTSSQFQRDPPRSFSQSQREPAGSFRSSQRERESPSSFSRSQPESMSRKPSDTSRSNFLPSRNGSLQEQPLASASSSRTNGSLSRSQQNTSKDSSATTARNMMQTPSKEERNAPGYSSSAASYENKVFDSPPGGNGFAAEEDGSLDQGMDASYGDFKNYLENQTEAIVHSIQSLLAAIRGGVQGKALDDHLSEITTIVSAIVSMASDNLTPSTEAQGNDILRELSNNCGKLQELQESEGGGGASNKQAKQAIASASFAIARSLKQLNLLFPDSEPDA